MTRGRRQTQETERQLMSRHRSTSQHTALTVVTVVIAVAAIATVGILLLRNPSGSKADEATSQAPTAPSCDTTLHVVTASSFAPVVNGVTSQLAAADPCIALRVDVADGRGAAARAAELGAQVWIPDDASWAAVAGADQLAAPETAGSGTVIATSPIYMVADQPTAERVQQAGGSWLGLADLVSSGSGVRLVIRDPAGSGDGLVAAGSVGEAVWVERGMDESAEALASALPAIRNLPGSDPALPEPGEVGLVPEYALLNALAAQEGGGADAGLESLAILPGTDHRAQLRYTWFPTAAAAADPVLAPLLTQTLQALTGAEAGDALASAGLRRPTPERPPVPPRIACRPSLPNHSMSSVSIMSTMSSPPGTPPIGGPICFSSSTFRVPWPTRPRGQSTPLIDLVRDGALRWANCFPMTPSCRCGSSGPASGARSTTAVCCLVSH